MDKMERGERISAVIRVTRVSKFEKGTPGRTFRPIFGKN
jgi:hypothetical protein